VTAENFERALALVLVHEGGCDDDPNDPGGRTKAGITHIDYDAYRKRKGLPLRDVFKMEDSERDEIYRTQYWDKVSADDLPSGLDYVVFDGAINSGVAQSVKWLQRALGSVAADGHLGNVTLAAVGQYPDQSTLIQACCEARREFLRNLKTFKYFGKGWIIRVNDVQKIALAWSSGVIPAAAAPAVKPQPKAVRSDGLDTPSTAMGDTLTAVGTAGLATATAVKGTTIAVAPPAPVTAPAASITAPTPATKISPPQTATPAPVKTTNAPATQAITAKAPPQTVTTTALPEPKQPLSVITRDQFWGAAAVLAIVLTVGVYLAWRARSARIRHRDALGDTHHPKTALQLSPDSLASLPETALPVARSIYTRVLVAAWVLLTLVVDVVACAKLLQGFGLANENWHQPFYWFGTIYDQYAGQAFAATALAISQDYGIALPQWLMPAFVLYVSMASAFVVISTGLMKRSTSAESLWAAVVHAGWIFAIPAFVMDALRYHVVTRFAKQNTVLFFCYITTFMGAYVLIRFVNDDVLPSHSQQIESVAAMLPSGIKLSER